MDPLEEYERRARGDAAEEREPIKGGWAVKLLAALGLLQLYNIVAHYQTLADLSDSFALIREWWHHITRLIFEFLCLDLSQWQRDGLILCFFMFSVANLSFYRLTRRILTFSVVRAFATNDPSVFDEMAGHSAFRSCAELIVIAAAMGFVMTLLPFSLSTLVLIGVQALALTATGYLEKDHAGVVKTVAWWLVCVAMLPSAVAVTFAYAVGVYRIEIARSLRFLILFLLADFAARYAVDPLIQAWPELPRPPT